MKNDIDNVNRDFVHLSRAIDCSNAPICYELLVILENCSANPDYLKGAEENMIAYAAMEEKIKKQLEEIATSEDKDFEKIKSIAQHFIKNSAANDRVFCPFDFAARGIPALAIRGENCHFSP